MSMFESGTTNPSVKKSYEIAYALCRIAAKIPEKYFSDALASEGVKILGSVAGGEYAKANNSLAAAEYFIRLGAGVGSVNTENGELLLGEITVLRDMIAGLLKTSKIEPADLSGIFTAAEELVPSIVSEVALAIQDLSLIRSEIQDQSGNIPASQDNKSGNTKTSGNVPATINFKSEGTSGKSGNDNNSGIVELIKSGNRQGAILEKIRQSGNCRTKEIQDLFPGCSERTLRYDLQSLTEQNLIEKVGVGGPAVFYRSRS